MRLLAAWAALALALASTATCLSSAAAQSNNSSPVAVTGSKSGIDSSTGERPARQNIDVLYSRGGAQWDLYIQALAAFQAVNETDELSYFQISGIHGLPYVAWNGVEQETGAPRAGYCPHGELLFATWHRPFVALFEQRLISHASDIANAYPTGTRATYQEAAARLRQPYWDWAASPDLPVAATLTSLSVNGPHGPLSMANPLYQYRFQTEPTGNGFDGPLTRVMHTLRCPDAGSLANNATGSDVGLDANADELSSYTYDTFIRSTDFQDMASMSGGRAFSFEAPHNIVHNNAGCANGTLGDVNWSAFDPIFMLHHANVDRLVAMWQAIYYNRTMFNITATAHGTFGTPVGSNVTADSPLKPFFDADLKYHTSRGVTRLAPFGYTYPEINDWDTTPAELAASVRTAVNALYGQSAASDGRALARSRYYYTAEVVVDRADLAPPCTIMLVARGRVLGRMALLATPSTGTVRASLPLANLSGKLGLADAAADAVVALLRETVEIQVRRGKGTLVPLAAIPSLKVHVRAVDYVPSRSRSEFPSFGKATTWPIHGVAYGYRYP